MIRTATWLGVLLVVLRLTTANTLAQQVRLCGTRAETHDAAALDEKGGIYITSGGTLRVLVVFASFPDDETPHPYWPAHNPPLSMQEFIDPDTTTHSQSPFNLTNYFHQMSLGQFHVVGEAVWVEMMHSQLEYWNNAFGRANLNALQERVDSLVDFSLYDRWTRDANYNHTNVPDGQVDMILMIWRTTMWEFLGEASLGYRPGFVLDGKRIEMGFPTRFDFPLGSGVTCKYPYNDTPYQAAQTMIHEVGHWLLGGPHPYNGMTIFGKHAYWGLLCDGHRVASCANSYERERLGWINVPEIQPDVNISLPDYVSSGISFKYHPPNGDPGEYFYIENHQRLSVFDDITTNPEDKGLWILHQQGPYLEMDNLKIVTSDGNWSWENPGVTTGCFSQTLPVFRRGTPKVMRGESHRDQIPTQTSLVNWLFVYEDPAGLVKCGAFFRGEQFDGTFRAETNPVFSEYSNPGTSTWGHLPTPLSLEVTSTLDGIVTARYNSNALDGVPARRYLGIDPGAHDSVPGVLHLAWGAQWPEGQPLETDVDWSEVQRQIGSGGNWVSVYGGPAASWSDGSMHYDSSGTIPVLFRARVRDTQGKFSAWSNVLFTKAIPPNAVDDPTNAGNRYELEANYPNPFNPVTTIGFSLPADQAGIQVSGFTTLKVYDVLGREVRTLVNAELKAGSYFATFEAADMASGLYFYRLNAGGFTFTRKMLLLR